MLEKFLFILCFVLCQVNAIQLKETVEENTSTTERVFQDRQYQVRNQHSKVVHLDHFLAETFICFYNERALVYVPCSY